jgi:hypothetical protein
MMSSLESIWGDAGALASFVKDSGLKFRDAILEYYSTVGVKAGFTVLKSSSVIVGGLDLGRVDLVYKEADTVFIMEFGLLEDIYIHLYRIMLLKPAHCVLLLSSNSKCRPDAVKRLIGLSRELDSIEFHIVDVTRYEVL